MNGETETRLKLRLELELDRESIAALCVLCPMHQFDATSVAVDATTVEMLVIGTLYELSVRACDGVYRPASWEREVFVKLFGDEWLDRLEPDPVCSWRDRAKRVAAPTFKETES